MPKQPPLIPAPPPPDQTGQNTIVQQLLDVITTQACPTTTTPVNKAYSKTSPEHASLLSWYRHMAIGKLPAFWKAFQQAITDNGPLQILEKFMAHEKSSDYFISYSLRPNWIKDITKQKFWYLLSSETLHHGITPFTLQKLNTWNEANLFIFEETAKHAMHITMEDLN